MLLPDRTLLGHRLDSGRQTALLTGSGVLVENVAAGETVEDAGGLLEFFSSSGLVASGDELLDSLDGGAITGALSGEAEVVLDVLTNALASLLGICHFEFPFRSCPAESRSRWGLCLKSAMRQKRKI